MADYESDVDYLKSWSAEISARADRVRQLIGSSHWPTDGRHKEVILREFLDRYLPSSLVVGSGFIKAASGACSGEIDILISDSVRHPAYFNEGGIQIIPPSSVVGYLEVKSTYSASNIKASFEKILRVQTCLQDIAADKWRCVFFIDCDVDCEVFVQNICKVISDIIASGENGSSKQVVDILPTCVATLESSIAFLRHDDASQSIIVNCFDFRELSSSIAFGDLFEHIRSHYGDSGVGELSELIQSLPYRNYIQRVVAINE